MTERWKNRERKYIKRRYGMKVDGVGIKLLARLIPKKRKR